MGCFPCFTTSKHRKPKPTSPPSLYQGNHKVRATQQSTNLQIPLSQLRDINGDQLFTGRDDKTVASDTAVQIDVRIPIQLLGKEDKEETGKLGVLVQLENQKEREKEENGKLGALVQIENEKERNKQGFHVEIKKEPKEDKVFVQTENEEEPQEENSSLGELGSQRNGNKNEVKGRASSDSSVSSYISYPPMHRYHNCEMNEDEDLVMVQGDSSESLFSLSIDPRRQSKSCPVEVDEKEVNSPLKITCSPELNAKATRSDLNQSIDSLLNPIQNLAQWKSLKTRPEPASDHHQEKENVCLEQEETHLQFPDRKGKLKKDSAVTTSLSSWLIEADKTPTASKGDSQFSTGNSYAYSDGATSWKSFEDRPILGAWTIDEVKQISARSSPRKSPCHNPDEMPIIGSVGSYWSHAGQTTDSSNSYSSPIGKSKRNREKKASSCHSTPSKTRMVRTLEKDVGAA